MSGRTSVMVCLAVATASAAPVQVSLDTRAINEAIAIGQSRVERERTRFHAPYQLPVNRPPVDFVDVVTPFRRIVLVAESRAQVGDRSFGQRRAFEVLDSAPAEIALSVALTFHPLHTFVGVPDYAVSLVEEKLTIQPRSVERLPRYGPRVEGTPSPLPIPGGLAGARGSQPMLGGTIIAHFDARPLKPAGLYDVVIEDAGKELARARVDFSKLR